MTRQIIVVDVETNGLDLDRHQAVEVAWWNLTTDERGQFVPAHDVRQALADADIQALRVNRYIDRVADTAQDRGAIELLRLWEQFAGSSIDEYEEPFQEHTLAGANPAFDAHFLRRLNAKLYAPFEIDQLTPWHHRLWDLSAFAAGVLGLGELPGLKTVCELLEITPGDHPAEGDVTATGLCFRALQQIARDHSTPETGA